MKRIAIVGGGISGLAAAYFTVPHVAQRIKRFDFEGDAKQLADVVGIIAVVVWFTLSGRIVSRFRAPVTAPAVTAVPVGRDATLPTDPSSASADREETSTVEGLAHPAAAPRPAPVVERQERATAPVADDRPRPPVESRAPADRPARPDQPGTDAGDGSAIIDWLLKKQR